MPGFDSKQTLPIIGQPFTFRDWWPTTLLNCNCPEKSPLLISGIGRVATCQACGRSVLCQGMAVNKNGEIGVHLVPVVLTQQPTPDN